MHKGILYFSALSFSSNPLDVHFTVNSQYNTIMQNFLLTKSLSGATALEEKINVATNPLVSNKASSTNSQSYISCISQLRMLFRTNNAVLFMSFSKFYKYVCFYSSIPLKRYLDDVFPLAIMSSAFNIKRKFFPGVPFFFTKHKITLHHNALT